MDRQSWSWLPFVGHLPLVRCFIEPGPHWASQPPHPIQFTPPDWSGLIFWRASWSIEKRTPYANNFVEPNTKSVLLVKQLQFLEILFTKCVAVKTPFLYIWRCHHNTMWDTLRSLSYLCKIDITLLVYILFSFVRSSTVYPGLYNIPTDKGRLFSHALTSRKVLWLS